MKIKHNKEGHLNLMGNQLQIKWIRIQLGFNWLDSGSNPTKTVKENHDLDPTIAHTNQIISPLCREPETVGEDFGGHGPTLVCDKLRTCIIVLTPYPLSAPTSETPTSETPTSENEVDWNYTRYYSGYFNGLYWDLHMRSFFFFGEGGGMVVDEFLLSVYSIYIVFHKVSMNKDFFINLTGNDVSKKTFLLIYLIKE